MVAIIAARLGTGVTHGKNLTGKCSDAVENGRVLRREISLLSSDWLLGFPRLSSNAGEPNGGRADPGSVISAGKELMELSRCKNRIGKDAIRRAAHHSRRYATWPDLIQETIPSHVWHDPWDRDISTLTYQMELVHLAHLGKGRGRLARPVAIGRRRQ